MNWPTNRGLFRRNRRIPAEDAALLIVTIVGGLAIIVFGG